MAYSEKTQDLPSLRKNIHPNLDIAKPSGFMFGLSRRPTKNEVVLIAKYIAVILASCILARWQTLHDFLNPKLSKIAEPVGVILAFLTLFLLFTALEKRGLLKEKYDRGKDNASHDDGSFD